MVAYDKDGLPYSVKYQLLLPMLLNELQKEHKLVLAQHDVLQTQHRQIIAQQEEIQSLKLQLQEQNSSSLLKNALLEERLTRLESYIQTQTTFDVRAQSSANVNGGVQ
jgi:hypothetical protein